MSAATLAAPFILYIISSFFLHSFFILSKVENTNKQKTIIFIKKQRVRPAPAQGTRLILFIFIFLWLCSFGQGTVYITNSYALVYSSAMYVVYGYDMKSKAFVIL